MAEANKAVSQAEAIKRFRVLGTDFTEDNGMLTPSLKLKRSVVLKEFDAEVEALYRTDPAAPRPSPAQGGTLQRGR